MSGGAGGNDQFSGQQGLTDRQSDVNRHGFQADQIQGERRTHFVAKIVKVYNRNSRTEPCTVDIQPIVKQMDGIGKASSHGTIYGVPVPRNQSGDSVVINDPQVGDVAKFSVFDRDHSSAQSQDWKEANPGSYRRSTMSDAVFDSVLPRKSQQVKQYIIFTDDGVEVHDRNGNSLVGNQNDGWVLNKVKIDRNGNIKAAGGITAGDGTSGSVTLQGHVHAGGPAPTSGT